MCSFCSTYTFTACETLVVIVSVIIVDHFYLGHIQQCYTSKRWSDLLKLIEHTIKAALKNEPLSSEWVNLRNRFRTVQQQVKYAENALAFTFVEVSFVLDFGLDKLFYMHKFVNMKTLLSGGASESPEEWRVGSTG